MNPEELSVAHELNMVGSEQSIDNEDLTAESTPTPGHSEAPQPIFPVTAQDLLAPSLARLSTPFSSSDDDVKPLGDFLTRGSVVGLIMWAILMGAVFFFSPPDSFTTIQGDERIITLIAFVLLLVTNVSRLLPLLIRDYSRSMKTGVMIGSCAVQGIALSSLAAMLFFPTPVVFDIVTKRKVALVRWAEWTPLAFLMTFLTEGINLPFNKSEAATKVKIAWVHAACMAISTFAGMIFPFCTTRFAWCAVFVTAFLCYTSIFVRLYQRMTTFKEIPKGNLVQHKEHYDRARLSLRLLQVCVFWWTMLVVAFSLCCAMPFLATPGSFWADPSLGVIVECVFEVGSKIWYLSLILDVHILVFDEGSRAVRRLEEMRAMMSVVWGSSSDIIVLAVRAPDLMYAAVSPTFLLHTKLNPACDLAQGPGGVVKDNIALVLEVNKDERCKVFAMNMSNEITKGDLDNNADLLGRFVDASESSADQRNIKAMVKLLTSALQPSNRERPAMQSLYGFGPDGNERTIQCEAKITTMTEDAVVIILRDISERFQRFEAEKQLVIEVTGRKKDAEANRFTRHEIKNGLLSAIGLVDTMKELSKPATSASKEEDARKKTQDLVSELDITLREILGTVLSEAMARDVVHEVYEPKREGVDIRSALKRPGGFSDPDTERFPITTNPDPFPSLHLDPQLLRHVHKNAMSNAMKYGQPGGTVTTEVLYDRANFSMRVINLPGDHHDELLRLDNNEVRKVFLPQTRLIQHSRHEDKNIPSASSGDGAWIMQKCARIMGGTCSITFEPRQTVFSLVCPVDIHDPNREDDEVASEGMFRLPENTWGVAMDDSGVQRKVLGRFFSLAGIHSNKHRILGGDANDVLNFSNILKDLVRENKEDKFLVIIDENLQITDEGAQRQRVSGSHSLQVALSEFTSDEVSRVLALVRSANDSKDDIAMYLTRAHGFMPKAPIQKDKVLDLIKPFWLDRFATESEKDSSPSQLSAQDEEDELGLLDGNLGIAHQDLVGALDVIDDMLSRDDGQSLEKKWPRIREKLHALRGDLKIMQSSNTVKTILTAMEKLRDDDLPDELEERWMLIRSLIMSMV